MSLLVGPAYGLERTVVAEDLPPIPKILQQRYYECKVLAGIRRILRQNECIVQIETFDQLDQVAAMMAAVGYDLVASFLPNFVFEKCASVEREEDFGGALPMTGRDRSRRGELAASAAVVRAQKVEANLE